MRKTETRTKTYEHKVAVICDVCQKEVPRLGTFEADDVEVRVTVRHVKGNRYPEGSFVDVFDPDICPSCFERVVLAALYGAGCDVGYKDGGW